MITLTVFICAFLVVTVSVAVKSADYYRVENTVMAGILCLIVGAIFSIPAIKFEGIDVDYSEGARTGVVVKLSQKGLVFKTWEGEMNVGSASAGEGGVMVPTVFQFSITDPAVIATVSEAAESGRKTTLMYKQKLVLPWRQGSTSYLIVGVK